VERIIFKYELPVVEHSSVAMPVGAKILCAHEQHGNVCLWALIDPTENRTKIRLFRIAGTGHPIEYTDQFVFIDTVFLDDGSLVFHVFEFKH
jgi:hypothetical protein